MIKHLLILLRSLFLIILFFFIFSISLVKNSINYRLHSTNNFLRIEILNKNIKLPISGKANKIIVGIQPQERFSTSQYLIQDKGFIKNSQQLINLLLSKKNSKIILKTPLKSSINFIHFNPFRSSLIINYGSRRYRFEVNIPDASLEIWNDNKKIENFSLKPPWLRLIIFPFLTSLLLGGLIYFLLNLIKKTKISSILNQQNPTKIFKSSNIDKVLGLGFFITGALITGYIFFKVFNAIPGFGDEMNYLIQAKIFAAGKFFVKEPSNPEFFKVGWMDIFSGDKKLWNFHPPGNSLILMLGQLLSIDWITIPIVGGLILLTQYFLALNLFENRLFALIHIIVITTSHYFLSLASTYMAHAPSLLFISLFYLFFIKFVKEKKVSLLYFASASIGFAFVIRPLSAVLGSIVPLIFLLFFLLKEKKLFSTSVAGSLLIGLMISSFIFFYSYEVNGKWTFPYLIKGPEVGQTLQARWSKDWDFKLKNLYRNSNEFQNRVHSLGYLFNYVFFLFPVFWLKKNKNRLWIIGGYLSFFLYLVIHSFLHWYGWKWEPRMIYDISFIFFLLTSYGIWQCYAFVKSDRFQKIFFIVIFLILLFSITFSNLPYRFRTEYEDYNAAAPGVRNTLKKKRISNAIIFFENEKIFAQYAPGNSLNFDGDIIYALSQNEDYDYKLIAKYPEKDIYYSTDANTLKSKPNFYQMDYDILKQQLVQKFKNKNVFIVIPWLRSPASPLDKSLPGKKINLNKFINLLLNYRLEENSLIVFLDRSQRLKSLLVNFYDTDSLKISGYATPVSFESVTSKKETPSPSTLPLLKMNCFEGDDWNGKKIKSELVSSINVADCSGENKSIEWTTFLNQKESKQVEFFLDSDDGSEIIIDGKSILRANQNGKQTTQINLEKGLHSLTVKFSNGPDGEYLRFGMTDPADFNIYLPKNLWN